MRFLLDTNIVSEIRKPRPAAALLAWFTAQEADSLYVSVMTLGEIREGVERLRSKDPVRADALGAWLQELAGVYADRVLAVDDSVASEWGRLRASVRRSLPVIDALIAATARVHRLVLVTRNERDFKGLGVEMLTW